MNLTDRLLSLVGLGALVRMAPAAPLNAIEVLPPSPGVTVGRVASKPRAAADLNLIARAPYLYAGVTQRSESIATYPLRVYRNGKPIEPAGNYAWVRDYLNLFASPDPGDMSDPKAIFPRQTGSGLLAQLVADRLMCGVAWVLPTLAEGSGRPIALTRLHPRQVAILRVSTGDQVEYRPTSGTRTLYPIEQVCRIRGVSANLGGEELLGTGAGEPLSDIVEAESQAMRKTATVISQGGVDLIIRATSPTAAAMLIDEATRARIVDSITEQLRGGYEGDRRVMALGGEFEIVPAGFEPADLQAAEMIKAAHDAELAAIGVSPTMIGGAAANYATALVEMRVQYERDATLAQIIADALFTPLIRYCARLARQSDATFTAGLDLSGHPGAVAMRTESINRMQVLVGLGWSPAQAAAAEGVDLPTPAAPPNPKTAPSAAPAGGEPTAVGEGAASARSGLPWLRQAPVTPRLQIARREVDKFTGSMLSAFRVGLRWQDEGYAGDGLKPETVRRASWAVDTGGPPSDRWVVEASAWHRRHHPNGVRPIDGRKADPSPLDVATALWGILGPDDAAWWDRQREALDADRVAAAEAEVAATEAAAASTRGATWAAVDARRAPHQKRIQLAARATQAEELAAYQRRIRAALPAAVQGERAGGGTAARLVSYGAVDWAEVLGSLTDARARWLDGLSPSWVASWEEAAATALPGYDLQVPLPAFTEATLAELESGAAAVADYSRERVRLHVEAGIRDGLSVVDIAESLRQDQAFEPFRALRIARTETIRSDSAGVQARGAEATRVGVEVEQGWLSDPMAAMWDRRHDRLDGETRPLGGTWRTPLGVETRGPGLSGDPGEDCNCVCATALVVKPRPAV
jgi:hypothetical protein